jgi:PAS domain S-box-containing protein
MPDGDAVHHRDDDDAGVSAPRKGNGNGDGEQRQPPPPAWRLAEVRRLREELGRAIDALDFPSDLAADAVPFAEAIVETLHEPLLVLRSNLKVLTANPSFYSHFEVTPQNTIGRMIYDLGNGQWDIPALRTALEQILPWNKVVMDFEVIHELESLGRRVMLINARQLDHVQLIFFSIRDVTAEHGAAAALRGRDSQFRTMVDNLPDYAMLTTDPSGVITDWTRGAQRVTGHTPEEAIGRHVALIYTPEQAASDYVEREFAEAAETGRAEREDWRMRKGGERFWANEIVTPIRHRDGTLRGFAKITRDLGQRRWIEKELCASEERFRIVADDVKDYGIFMADVSGIITSWNPGAEHIFGYARDEIVGRDARILFTPEDQATRQHEQELELARQEGRASDDRWQMRKNGERFWAAGVTTAMRDAAGNVVGFIKILRDETERKRLEEQLKQTNEALERRVSERTATLRGQQLQLRSLLAEVGREEIRQRRLLATELHDNLAQLLAVCKMRVSAIEAYATKDPAAARTEATAVKDALGEAIAYTRTLMTDLRPHVLDEHDLPAAIEWVGKRMARHGLKVTVEDDGEPKPLHEDVIGFLFQAVRELLWNVVKHARATEANVVIERPPSPDGQPSGHVRVTVEDHGAGFDAATRAALPSEHGGFGLFSIAERIDLLGGTMQVDSAPRRGTRVTLTAPLDLPAPTSGNDDDGGNRGGGAVPRKRP